MAGPSSRFRDLVIGPAYQDEHVLSGRDDYALYDTPPLQSDLEVIGSPSLKVYVQCDRPDTDITFRLCDYDPDAPEGRRTLLLMTGVRRMRYRSSWTSPSPMDPDDIYDAAFTIVNVQELTLGELFPDGFGETGEERFYSVTVAEEQDLEIRFDDLDDSGVTELYAGFRRIPTLSEFEYRAMSQPAIDPVLRVPGTRAGTYYLLAFAGAVPEPGPSEFTIIADYVALAITSVTPDQGWTADPDPPAATILGSGFHPDATVLLRRAGQGDLPPTDVTWLDMSTMFARFDVQGAEPGGWDLMVTNPDSASAAHPFNVIAGAPAKLEANLILPRAIRWYNGATFYIEYANTGEAPMPAPLLKLHCSDDALLTTDETLAGPPLSTENPPRGLTDTVQVLALGSGSDPSVLNPGDSGTIAVYYRGLKQPWHWPAPTVECTLGALTAHDTAVPIDWDEVKAQIRPDDIASDLWATIWPRLQSQIGTTWTDYLNVLNENAAYLASNGKRTHNVRELFSLEVAKAMNAFVPPRTLASSVDAYSPAPGLPVVFARLATDSLLHRFFSVFANLPADRGQDCNTERRRKHNPGLYCANRHTILSDQDVILQ